MPKSAKTTRGAVRFGAVIHALPTERLRARLTLSPRCGGNATHLGALAKGDAVR